MSERVINASVVTRKTVTLVLDEQTATDLSGLVFNGLDFDNEPWAAALYDAIKSCTADAPTRFLGEYLARSEG